MLSSPPAYAVLNVASIVWMLSVALILIAGTLEKHGWDEHGPTLILPAHLLAHCCAWERLLKALYTEGERLPLWRSIGGTVCVLVDWLQFACIAYRQMANDMRILDSSCLLSLVCIFFEDFVGVMLMSLPAAAKVESARAAPVHFDTFEFKNGDVKVGLGKPGFAQSTCHICLEEMQEGETVAKLLCGHLFHDKCITQWLQRGSGCPLRCEAAHGGAREWQRPPRGARPARADVLDV
mmetsp:Transcript_65218/g.121572  ORF Transcript_65218/g.121572 Transcript_65218/m.121572 type:complete len:237 (-) Transcript_65218:82-792(-)